MNGIPLKDLLQSAQKSGSTDEKAHLILPSLATVLSKQSIGKQDILPFLDRSYVERNNFLVGYPKELEEGKGIHLSSHSFRSLGAEFPKARSWGDKPPHYSYQAKQATGWNVVDNKTWEVALHSDEELPQESIDKLHEAFNEAGLTEGTHYKLNQ